MPMITALRRVQLDETHGLACSEEGLRLAGVDLLRRTPVGLELRPRAEIEALFLAAYGAHLDRGAILRGAVAVANALNQGDTPRAMITALYLKAPPLDTAGRARVATVSNWLAKYSPDQPRDWHGRWTPEGGSGGPSSAQTADRPPPASSGLRILTDLHGDSRPSDGSPYPADCQEMGDNGPPDEPIAEVGPEPASQPSFDAPKVPDGWDIPGHTVDGLYYPTVRFPKLPDGTPWPVATHDAIQAIMRPVRGGTPQMTLFVPLDKIGPTLIGSTDTLDYPKPEGYDEVRLWGAPQVTYSRGEETGHAADSVSEALRMAETNQFSDINFNRAISTSTGRQVLSAIRPDVMGVVRPELDLDHLFHPYESLSPGQDIEERREEMPQDVRVKPAEGQQYYRKRSGRSPYFIFLDIAA
jgi:hypothetical protein